LHSYRVLFLLSSLSLSLSHSYTISRPFLLLSNNFPLSLSLSFFFFFRFLINKRTCLSLSCYVVLSFSRLKIIMTLSWHAFDDSVLSMNKNGFYSLSFSFISSLSLSVLLLSSSTTLAWPVNRLVCIFIVRQSGGENFLFRPRR
jgi:hypothetical protein